MMLTISAKPGPRMTPMGVVFDRTERARIAILGMSYTVPGR